MALPWHNLRHDQGTWNLYGRDSKFRDTFKSGIEKRWFSLPLLMTGCHQFDLPKSKLNIEWYIFCCTGRQKCTKLHRFASTFSKIFPEDTTGPIHNWGEGKPPACPCPDPLPYGARPLSHFSRASAAAGHDPVYSVELGAIFWSS